MQRNSDQTQADKWLFLGPPSSLFVLKHKKLYGTKAFVALPCVLKVAQS